MLLDKLQTDADFWSLWENNKKIFFRKCLKILNGDICQAEDALSVAMLKAREKMIGCRDRIHNFRGWALRLTENVCLDHLRSHRRLISYDEIPESLVYKEADHGHLFMESTERYHSREAILKGIFDFVYELPRRLREPALLRFLFSEPYRDIAARLQITEENARKRIQEARSALKLKYGEKIISLLMSPAGEAGLEPDSPVMKRIRDDARSILNNGGPELELPCMTAWIVNALPVNGIDEEILVFLPIKPVWHEKGFEPFLDYISRHPGGWKRHLELAQILCAAGIWDQAEKHFRHVIKKHPRSFSAWIHLGNMLSESGRTDEAEKLFRQAREVAFHESSRHYLAGMAAMCRRDRNKAAESFRRACGLEPSNVSFQQARGVCLFRSALYTDALRLFEEILSRSPGDIVSLAYCCELSIILNRPDNAEKCVDRILENNPHDHFALTRKAGLAGRRGSSGKEERMRMQRITGRFDNLARIIRGQDKENSRHSH